MYANPKIPKNPREKYVCKPCHYITSHLGDWNKHVSTGKHEKLTDANQKSHACICGSTYVHKESLSRHKRVCSVAKICDHSSKTVIQSYPFVIHGHPCGCGRAYKYASGLSKHKKTCLHACSEDGTEDAPEEMPQHNEVVSDGVPSTELSQALMGLKKDNDEMKAMIGGLHEQVLEVAKEPKFVTNNNNFNVFLTEKCAEALSIGDFVQRLHVSLHDLAFTVEKGKRAGIANIIRKGLEELGVYRRPMHCTDLKRQTLYIKDKGEWSKEDTNEKMDELVRAVDGSQFKATRKWEQANPEYDKSGRVQDKWIAMINTVTQPVNQLDVSSVTRECSKETHLDRKAIADMSKNIEGEQ